MSSDVMGMASAGLSVDQAATLLAGRDGHDEDDALQEAPDSELLGAADEPDSDPDPDDEQAPFAIKPPHSWDAEAKARFRELPEDVQELISEREGERDRATSRAMQEAAETRKRADVEAAEAAQMTQALDQLIPQAAQTFASKWEGVNWDAWAAADPQAALQGWSAFEAERGELQRLGAVQQQVEALDHQRFVAREAVRLKDVAPELADPKTGPQQRQTVAQFLTELGATPTELAGLSAEEAGLAYDAMRWRRAQAGLAAKGRGAGRTVKPSAAASGSSAGRSAKDALARLNRSGSVDDAVAYLRQRG